jgi:hypothetical protein
MNSKIDRNRRSGEILKDRRFVIFSIIPSKIMCWRYLNKNRTEYPDFMLRCTNKVWPLDSPNFPDILPLSFLIFLN